MKIYADTSIESIGLSARATNALLREGIDTLGVFLLLPEESFRKMRGVGSTVLDELIEKRRLINSGGSDVNISTYSFGEYLKKSSWDDRAFKIVVDYYNNYYHGAMAAIAAQYGITRSRVQQIVEKATKKLESAYMTNVISGDALSNFDDYAFQKTEIHTIKTTDPYFSGAGIAYLVSNFNFGKYSVFSNNNINGDWLVFTDDNVAETFKILFNDLRYRDEPLRISDVEQLYSINEDMLMSIKGIIEKDGYVTHEKNKLSTGQNRHYIVTKYFETIGRPASISEITENTTLSLQQVRGALGDKEKYINVGKSVYDLADRKYENASIESLAIMILTAEDRALKSDLMSTYIKRYKDVDDYEIAYALLDSSSVYRVDDYYLLNGWSTDKIIKREITNYTVGLDEAVLEIISSSDDVFDYEKVAKCLEKYGDSVSHVPSSIKTTLVRLADRRLIKRVGGSKTGCYMRVSNDSNETQKLIDKKMTLGKFINANIGKKVEIRYKTDRVNSEKRWRTISVRGQDARYIYTDDLNNFDRRVKYVKEKVVEYRELS